MNGVFFSSSERVGIYCVDRNDVGEKRHMNNRQLAASKARFKGQTVNTSEVTRTESTKYVNDMFNEIHEQQPFRYAILWAHFSLFFASISVFLFLSLLLRIHLAFSLIPLSILHFSFISMSMSRVSCAEYPLEFHTFLVSDQRASKMHEHLSSTIKWCDPLFKPNNLRNNAEEIDNGIASATDSTGFYVRIMANKCRVSHAHN